MTTLFKLNSVCVDTQDETKLHFMPAEIQYDGKANVQSYFETTVNRDDDKMTASLRGRPLQGMEMKVPSGYTGLVMKETKKAITEDEDRELSAVQSFKTFNYWNLDKQPTEQDAIKRALQWIDISKALHGPADSSDDSQASLKSEPSM